jgi:cytochrome c-type biogenesis protein CcmH/NrfG
VWQIAVIPTAFLLLAAAILRPGADPGRAAGRELRLAPRLGLAALAVISLVAVAIPLAGTDSVRDSQADVRAADLGGALDRARSAEEIQPYAATPGLQQALVLELQGDLAGAAAAAGAAVDDEPNNWRNWLVLSRIEAERGNAAEAVDAYRKARSLNPRSPLFAE